MTRDRTDGNWVYGDRAYAHLPPTTITGWPKQTKGADRVWWRSERGSLTPMLAVLMMIITIANVWVYERGAVITAVAHALDIADSAARAGGNRISEARLRTAGIVEIDPVAARAAVYDFLIAAHARGTVVATPQRVVVTVYVSPAPSLFRFAAPGGGMLAATSAARPHPTAGRMVGTGAAG